MPKNKNRKLRLVVGKPEKDNSKRYISGRFCPMVALVRVTAKKQFDQELGIAPLYYIDSKDGRAKSNLTLQIIRWNPQHKQFTMEHRVMCCPVDRHGREMSKERPLRASHRQKMVVGNIHLRTNLHSEMRYNAAHYLSEDVERHIDLFEIPYSLDDARDRKAEPSELQELPRQLPRFRLLAPEKVEFQKIIVKDVGGREVETVKNEVAVPNFFGPVQFEDVRNRTPAEVQERGLLDVTPDISGLKIDYFPLVMWGDITLLHGWSPVHVSALSGACCGIPVQALDPTEWAYTDVCPQSAKDQKFELWRRWRELVAGDELLQKHPELAKLGPFKAWAYMAHPKCAAAADVKPFEEITGVGPKTAEKIGRHLLHETDFKGWIQLYPVLTSMVSEVKAGWVKEEEKVSSAPREEAETPSSDAGYGSF